MHGITSTGKSPNISETTGIANGTEQFNRKIRYTLAQKFWSSDIP